MLKYFCNDVTIKLIMENFIRFLLDEENLSKRKRQRKEIGEKKGFSTTIPKILGKTGRKFSNVKVCIL